VAAEVPTGDAHHQVRPHRHALVQRQLPFEGVRAQTGHFPATAHHRSLPAPTPTRWPPRRGERFAAARRIRLKRQSASIVSGSVGPTSTCSRFLSSRESVRRAIKKLGGRRGERSSPSRSDRTTTGLPILCRLAAPILTVLLPKIRGTGLVTPIPSRDGAAWPGSRRTGNRRRSAEACRAACRACTGGSRPRTWRGRS